MALLYTAQRHRLVTVVARARTDCAIFQKSSQIGFVLEFDESDKRTKQVDPKVR